MATKKVVIKIRGMTCASCAQTIEKALVKQPGVIECSVNLASEKANIEYDPGKTTPHELTEAIRSTGYEPDDPSTGREEGQGNGEGSSRTISLKMVAVDKKVIGLVSVADTLKDDTADAIRELEEMGLRTIMLTGDNKQTARAIGKEIGITEIHAEVMPDEKVEIVKQAQKKYGMVAMVGDGINDAPALTQANVGVAIGTGTDIAIEAGDVILVRGDLSSLISAIRLSRSTFSKIKQNLFWAFIYNAIAIPIAVLGLMHPAIAEVAMATSSISVVTNANLLRRARIQPNYLD